MLIDPEAVPEFKVETVFGRDLNPGETVFIGGVWRKLVEVVEVDKGNTRLVILTTDTGYVSQVQESSEISRMNKGPRVKKN